MVCVLSVIVLACVLIRRPLVLQVLGSVGCSEGLDSWRGMLLGLGWVFLTSLGWSLCVLCICVRV